MNSSPPPPSFTLPPLNSAGQFPITPSPTPSPDKERDNVLSPRKNKEAHNVEDVGRISMYVKLFDEMIQTVLASESYLFTAREIWVLRYILDLSCESPSTNGRAEGADDPKYLLTRLLIRRQGKIHPYTNLILAYSAELGDEGVKRAMKVLSTPLPTPHDLLDAEPDVTEATYVPEAGPSRSNSFSTPSKPVLATPLSAKARGKQKEKERRKPWSNISTGLSAEEEKADPDLAETIRESLWAAKVNRVELEEDGVAIATPPPEQRPGSSRSSSSSSNGSTSTSPPKNSVFNEEFSLNPKPPTPVSVFARDESSFTLDEIMSCISADELRKVARARKVPLSMLTNRDAVCTALRGIAKSQSVLGFTPVKGKSGGTTKQSTLPFSPASKITSESLLVSQLLPCIGNHAVQLTPAIHSLISRVNLIFSRTPPIAGSSSLMLPSILVTSHKRRYPDYGPPTRSTIWQDRQELLTWERAVGWEALVADALGDTWQEQRKNPTPGFGIRKEMIGRVEGAKVVKRIWEGVWPIWRLLVEGDGANAVEAAKDQGGLVGDRFKTGHVLTRIVYKGATALGILHEYDAECMVLRALLAQRRWRRGKRGAWYERLALVLMNHYNASKEEKEERCRDATQTCIDGLLDEDTHLIYRPALSRRLTRLEKKLDLPADERHISYASLNTCETRELTAPRVPDNMGQAKMRARPVDRDREREASLGMGDDDPGSQTLQQVGKSVWYGREGEVTVEGWVLEWWQKKGYKGYHSESSILTTLFALLLWPVLFHPLPGAFETPYQTAPLDLGEDTFSASRSDLLEERLRAMSKTSVALEMLDEVDKRERPKGTWAVGVNWEFPADDLREVLECLGGKGLAGVCRMLAEEYRHRVSGVPDLLVWDFPNRTARFVEVKGPGDSLSETQKVWIDVLLSAGIPVEVCKVKAKDVDPSTVKKRKRPQAGGTKKEERADGALSLDPELEAMDEDEEPGEFTYESGDEGKAEGHWGTKRRS